MKQIRIVLLSLGLIFAVTVLGQSTTSTADASSAVRATLASAPGTVFRDCPDCPEMVVIQAGSFMMGSSEAEKIWAATHGGNTESVADESPQHKVSLRSFALGKYDVTRAEYAVFVRETGYSAGDECFESSMP
jgi:formylglycine-generating enzyme required for sulfatase activity